MVTVNLGNDMVEMTPVQISYLTRSKNLRSKSVSNVKRPGQV